MKEEWRPVPGYEGLYEVSNMGRVRSLPRKVMRIRGSFFIKDGMLLKMPMNKKGYNEVGLAKNGHTKTIRVHRLVALAFVPNYNNLPMINHKDENKQNNRADNLEWCTNKYNLNYGTGKDRIESKRRPVCQYDIDGVFVGEYISIYDAAIKTGAHNSCIVQCCKGKIHTAGGYKWRYKTE